MSERVREQLDRFAFRQPDGSVIFPTEGHAMQERVQALLCGALLGREGATLYAMDNLGDEFLSDYPTRCDDGSLEFTAQGAAMLDKVFEVFGDVVEDVTQYGPRAAA